MKTAFEIKSKKYRTDALSVGTFQGFLNQCKRAIDKLHGEKMSVKHDFWSCVDRSIQYEAYKKKFDFDNIPRNKTFWDILKETGELHIQDGFYCVDFEFGGVVYAEYSCRAMIDYFDCTEEEFNEYLNKLN